MRRNRYGGHPPCPAKCGHAGDDIELIAIDHVCEVGETGHYICLHCGHQWSELAAPPPPPLPVWPPRR